MQNTSSFKAKSPRLERLSQLFPQVINKLESVFNYPSIIYVDFANVMPWSNRLIWNVDVKRLKQLFDSFPNIKKVRFYYGELKGNSNSQIILSTAKQYFYDVKTKEVKIIKQSIDVSSINVQSPDLLKQFISKSLLEKLCLVEWRF